MGNRPSFRRETTHPTAKGRPTSGTTYVRQGLRTGKRCGALPRTPEVLNRQFLIECHDTSLHTIGILWVTTHLQKLKNELTSRPENMLVLAGIGVSLATCPDAQALSWKGLLKNGLERCGEIGVDESRLVIQMAILSNPASTGDDYIGVGTFITGELRKVREGEYSRWLAEVFKPITPKNNRLVCALRTRPRTTP